MGLLVTQAIDRIQEQQATMPANPGTTNPGLLSRLADWRDDPAWGEFYTRYSPLIHARCRRFYRDEDAAEDASQRIWIGLSDRLLTFRYDPNGSFRLAASVL